MSRCGLVRRGAAGLHALVPYFTQLIAEEVQRSLHDLPRLHLLLQVLPWSLYSFSVDRQLMACRPSANELPMTP